VLEPDHPCQTPNFDRLAARGVVFRHAYVQQAVCAASRNSLMSGLRPDQIGVYDLATWFRKGAPDAVTMTQAFIADGYRAESLGKIYHRGHGNKDDPKSWSTKSWWPRGDMGYDVTGGPKPPAGSKFRAGGNGRMPWSWQKCDPAITADGRIATHAIERLNALAGKKTPFFLATGFLKPHLPFKAPKRFWDLYDRNRLPVYPTDASLPVGAPSFAGSSWGELRKYTDIQAVGPLTAEQARTMVHGYYACVSLVDAQLGRLLDALDRSPARDNTIIVLWGDHGWHLGDHGLWCKHTNFEQATHNPVIIAAPGMTRGASTTALMESIDIYPTLCELAGVKAPSNLPGKSLVPVLKDPTTTVQDAVYQVYPRRPSGKRALGRAVRTSRYRYVEWYVWEDSSVVARELYDYYTDPEETVNLAGLTSNAGTMREMAKLLAKLPPPRRQVRK